MIGLINTDLEKSAPGEKSSEAFLFYDLQSHSVLVFRQFAKGHFLTI